MPREYLKNTKLIWDKYLNEYIKGKLRNTVPATFSPHPSYIPGCPETSTTPGFIVVVRDFHATNAKATGEVVNCPWWLVSGRGTMENEMTLKGGNGWGVTDS